MRRVYHALLLICGLAIHVNGKIEYVNNYIGTGGRGYGCGGVPVGVQYPFGMVRLSPDGVAKDDIWAPWTHTGGYHYNDTEIRYFSHVHMQGAGTMDYGNIGLMPAKDIPDHRHIIDFGFKQDFKHDNETVSPGYYQVYFPSIDVNVELTATQHVGVHSYTFASTGYVVFDVSAAVKKGGCQFGNITIDTGSGLVTGMMHNNGDYSGRFGGFNIYFAARIQISQNGAFGSFGVWNDTLLYKNTDQISGVKYVGGYVELKSSGNPMVVTTFVGVSFISLNQAMTNLNSEAPVSATFSSIQSSLENAWENTLSAISVSDPNATNDTLTVFYTSLYHACCAPTLFSEVGGYYLGFDGKVHSIANDSAGYYTDLSIWDVHRTQMPLLGLAYPDVLRDVARSLVLMYQQGGDVPRWPLANGYTNGMEGQHADIIFSDAFTKNLDFDYQTAYQGMYQGAMTQQQYASRVDVQFYNANGYVPYEAANNCASLTLEYAFDDWACGIMAKGLGYQQDYEMFSNRSQNYKNVFLNTFACPRYQNGTLFCPHRLYYPLSHYYTEGDAEQWRWFVPQDPHGLIGMFPNVTTFVNELDEFFARAFNDKRTILPNPFYWAGNEPDIFAVYLFPYANRSDLTQKYSREVADTWYSNTPQGIPGNDDYGTLSSWAVWTLLGLYPQAGNTSYILGSPAFYNSTILLPGNKSLQIIANNAGPTNVFVQKVQLNGQPLSNLFVDYNQIINGGVLEFWMVSSS